MVLLASCLVAVEATAQVSIIDPRLAGALESTAGDAVVPVIITLKDKVDVARISDADRSTRRSKIIAALKQKAEATQNVLEAFLKSRGALVIKRLWLINGVAVSLPASVIRALESLPGIESVRLDEQLSLPAAAPDQLSVGDAAVDERGGDLPFVVSLSSVNAEVVTVQYTTNDGTATAGSDFAAISGILTFLPGEVSQPVTVPVLEDTIIEGDESLSLVLSNPVNAVIADGVGSGTIFDNEAPAGVPEWNLLEIRAPELWARGYVGQGIVVASMDTGVDVLHPDLAPRWRGGSNSWFDPHGEHPVTPYDATGHGTRAMGLMVAGDATGTALGVAPGAKWIAAKIFDDAGNALNSDIHQGFQWVLDPDGDPLTDDAPDVVNNPWGFSMFPDQCISEFQLDIQTLRTADIAVVFAGGNRGLVGGASSISPGNNPEGYAIGAVDASSTVANFSSRGPSTCDGTVYPELVAPGVAVRTTDLSFGGAPVYTQVDGTSFAAPHVAGAVALLRSVLQVSVADLESALIASARDLGSVGPDNDYGNGLIDVAAAYQLLKCPAGSPDADGDGVPDACDNCIQAANGPSVPDAGGSSQRDTDGDGYGNVCDTDLNGDNVTNTLDVGFLKSVFLSQAPHANPLGDHADFNGDGVVNTLDVGILKSMFLQPPGPSCCGNMP